MNPDLPILRQRQPREEDPAYLVYVRSLPCIICRRPGPNDAAHIRSGARQYGKLETGMGEKPDDKWALPLCRTHHEDQHRHNELRWWQRQGIDPFAMAIALYAGRPNPRPPRRVRMKPTKPRKPVEERAKIAGRSEWPKGRKIQSKNSLRRAQ